MDKTRSVYDLIHEAIKEWTPLLGPDMRVTVLIRDGEHVSIVSQDDLEKLDRVLWQRIRERVN